VVHNRTSHESGWRVGSAVADGHAVSGADDGPAGEEDDREDEVADGPAGEEDDREDEVADDLDADDVPDPDLLQAENAEPVVVENDTDNLDDADLALYDPDALQTGDL
jgi:hypothetical protein